MGRLIAVAALLVAGVACSTPEQQPAEDRQAPAPPQDPHAEFVVDGWTIIGVWDMPMGLTLKTIIEESDGEFRLRYAEPGEAPKDEGETLEKKDGSIYVNTDSKIGDYLKIEEDGRLAHDDKEGYIRTTEPSR